MALDEAVKYDQDKPRYDLIPPEAVEGLADILGIGAEKYAPRNWEKGLDYGRVFASAQRHMWAWWSGEEHDRETGFSHLAHALTNIAFLIAFTRRGYGRFDDRPSTIRRKQGHEEVRDEVLVPGELLRRGE